MTMRVLFVLFITALLTVDSIARFKVMDKEEHPTKEGFAFYIFNFLTLVFFYLTITILLII